MLNFPSGAPEDFAAAEPFPHLVIDGLWPGDLLDEVAAEFPAADDRRWITYPDPKEYGKKAAGPNAWGPVTRSFFDAARSPEACGALQILTGIGPLTADFNVHPTLPLERRLNLLVFLNRGWDPAWGGTLYLGQNREVAVAPEFNRTVLFACGDNSWHGHPDPIDGDHLRRSLALYYYAPLRAETGNAHTTLWGGQ
jgi:hypothetical protein